MAPTTVPDVKKLFSQRLSQARRMRGVSLRELSGRMKPAVTYNALHKYETGVMLPESSTLQALSEALDQPVDFFFRPITATLESIEFRKKAKLGAKQVGIIREEAVDFFERYLQVEETLGLKTEFTNPIAGIVIEHSEDVENAAEKLREAWELGLDPLGNVVELLERRQVKVLLQKADPGFDGFSGWSGEIPVIVLNQEFPADRIRLTALHELGHLLMKFGPVFDEKAKEKLCHRFAGAMLMPCQTFKAEFGSMRHQVTLLEMKDIKADYGISIAAAMARARDLGLISDATYTQFCISRNRKGWNRKEPGEYTGEEASNRFLQLVYRAVATEAMSLSLAAGLVKMPLPEFRKSLQFVS